MSDNAKLPGDEDDGLCDECRAGNVQTPRVTYRPFTDEDRAKAAADVERWEREGLLMLADEEAGRPDIQPVSWLREDEDGMMLELHRVVAENPHLWWDADWIRRVYERHVRQQELEELVRSEEEARSEANYPAWIEAGYLAEYDVDRWLDEYERLGFLNPPHPGPHGDWDDGTATD